MAYIINRYDGTQLAIVDDGILDNTTPLGLIGRNYTGYGETQNENFVFLLENFASENPPARALNGQAWYDTTAKALKVYTAGPVVGGTQTFQWLSIGNATVSETEPAHSNGGLWLKVATQQLFVSDGTVWRQVGPEAADGFAVTKMTSTVLVDSQNLNKPVILVQLNGETTGIYANDDFTIREPILGFTTIKKGLNIKETHAFIGTLIGNATSASKLQTAIQINDVNFDGSSNITITASTTSPLTPGDYIAGSEFNGAVAVEWSVDATPENLVGKVVARDSVGSFSASTITADLFGNVAGNVTALSGISTFDQISVNTIAGNSFSGVAARATRLETPRTINTVVFDGTKDIIVPVLSNTLIGDTLASNVVDSSLTSLGKLATLAVEAPGIRIGDGNNINIYIEGFSPTIESDVTNVIRLKLATGSASTTPTTVSFISASAASVDGVASPAVVPDYNLDNPAANRPVLGLPSYRWKNVYATEINTPTAVVTTLKGSTLSDQVTVSNDLVINGAAFGTFRGNLVGTVTGNVTGNVTGAASLNMLKSGDTLSGDISWTTSGRGLSWSMNSDSASIRYYNTLDGSTDNRLEFNTGDNENEYFRWTHSPSGGSLYESMRLTPTTPGLANLRVTGQITVTQGISAATYIGDGNQLTNLNAAELLTGTVPAARLSGSYNINVAGNVTGNLQGNVTGTVTGNVTGSSSLNVLKAGDTLSGDLNWSTTGRGLTWGMNTDGASIRFYNTSDGDTASRLEFQTTDNGDEYFSWTHALSGGGTIESMRLVPNSSGSAALTVFGNATINGTTTGTFSGTGTSLTLNAANLTTGTVPRARLVGEYNINISGNANYAVRSDSSRIVDSITSSQIVTALGYVPSDTGLAATGIVGVSATISGPITSTSTSTGALVVAGGAGFGLDVTVGGSVTADDGFIGNLLTTGAVGVAGTVTGNWTLSAGSRLQATYADLAELYTSDNPYEAGTVLIFGGDAETTITTIYGDTRLAGVVSTNPAHLLNSALTGTVSAIALVGRIPCKVIGQIKKGDMLTTSSISGYATKMIEFIPGAFIGKALHDKETSGEGIVEISLNRA
jgi:hypothetical protein